MSDPAVEAAAKALATRYWFDTEFMEDGRTIELLSIGVVCEDGREFYAENRYANLDRANQWVKDNVIPSLAMSRGDKQASGANTPTEIAADLRAFVAAGASKPEFWAYYGDYDWVVLCQLFGLMIDLPESWPMFAMDVKQLAVSLGSPELPEQTSTEHHALDDALWTRDAWAFLAAADGARQTQAGDLRAELIDAIRCARCLYEGIGPSCSPTHNWQHAECAVDAVLARLDQLGVHREQDGQ